MVAPTRIAVAAGILCDDRGRVLIAERRGDGPFQGLWEFPGGKIAVGEAAEQALCRELGEELGVEARDVESFMQLVHDYPDRRVALEFFLVRDWLGEADGREGQALRWVRPEELDAAELLPADAPVIAALRKRFRP